MARLDGDSSYESSPYTYHFQGSENLLSEYEILHSHSFRNLDTFMEVCNEFYTDLVEGNKTEGETQYLGFTHVRMSDIADIDEIGSEIPKMRILYDRHEEILIMKFMVGVTHYTCSRLLASQFDRLVQDRTGLRRSIMPLGSARFRSLNRMKEADEAFKPTSRGLKTDWPSVAIEVGVSEGFTQLRLDARFWLESTGGQTRVVILVCIDRAARSMVIERWQHDAFAHSQNHTPVLVQSLDFKEGQVYAGASLIIPAALVYDNLLHVQGAALGPDDFEITIEMLNFLNEDLWIALN